MAAGFSLDAFGGRRRAKNATMSPKSNIAAKFAANFTELKCGVDFKAESGSTTQFITKKTITP